jgi:hypothetical protein
MIKKFMRSVFAGMGAGAPTPADSITFERTHGEEYVIEEGLRVDIWLKPDSYEIHAYERGRTEGTGLLGISHNYALARYIMQYGVPTAYIFSFSDNDLVLSFKYRGSKRTSEPGIESDFV